MLRLPREMIWSITGVQSCRNLKMVTMTGVGGMVVGLTDGWWDVKRSEDNGGSKQGGPSLPSVQGLGMGLPDRKSKKMGKQSVSKDSHVSEALDKLREQTRETVKGLESFAGSRAGDGLENNAMIEDWVKQFEEFAGGQDMESIVETMMQQLLSKEVLHEPMKEIGERYPKWLEDHKSNLSNEDFGRYSKQYEFIKELNIVYDTEPENFTKIVELMQKMQDCGQPPDEIVQELSPDFVLSSLASLSPDPLEQQPNCCIM